MSLPPDRPAPLADDGDAWSDAAPEPLPDTGAWSAADWQELANFLGREGSPDALAATERRLQTDAHFATLAAPLLTFWAMPLPGSDSAFDLDAGWAAIQQQAAARRLTETIAVPAPPRSSAAPTAPRMAPIKVAAPSLISRSVRHLPWRRRSVHPRWAMVGLLTVVVGYIALYVGDRPRERALHYYAATGVLHTVHLSDGSQAILAPGATLVTDGLTAGAQRLTSRTVHLDGSGTFVVHADPTHPFIVESHDIAAVAIGTVFHVAAAPTPTNTVSPAVPSAAGTHLFATDVQISVTSGKVMVQRRTATGRRETLTVLGPGQETSIHTFTRYFKAGWAAGAAHKSVAEAYLEYQAMKAADSARVARATQIH